MQYLNAPHEVGWSTIEASGAPAQPADAIARYSRGLWLAANGGEKVGQTQLVHLDTTTCAATNKPAPEPDITSVAASDAVAVTVNNLNNVNLIRVVDRSTGASRSAHVPGPTLSRVAVDGDRIYAMGDADGAVLVVLDLHTLKEVHRLRIPGVTGIGAGPVIGQTTLYYPQTSVGKDQRAGSAIGVIDLASWKQSTIPLKSPLPYQLELAGKELWVAHTFVNSSEGPLSAHRTLSRVTLTNRAVSTYRISVGIDKIAVRGNTLHVFGIASESGDHFQFGYRTYDAQTMRETSRLDLAPPAGDTYYDAGLVFPPS